MEIAKPQGRQSILATASRTSIVNESFVVKHIPWASYPIDLHVLLTPLVNVNRTDGLLDWPPKILLRCTSRPKVCWIKTKPSICKMEQMEWWTKLTWRMTWRDFSIAKMDLKTLVRNNFGQVWSFFFLSTVVIVCMMLIVMSPLVLFNSFYRFDWACFDFESDYWRMGAWPTTGCAQWHGVVVLRLSDWNVHHFSTQQLGFSMG